MALSRRGFFGVGAAATATVALPKTHQSGRNVSGASYILAGGASSDGILVNSTLDGDCAGDWVDLAVSKWEDMAEPTLVGKQKADGNSITRHKVRGLDPDTTYYARMVSDDLMVGDTVRFKTLPVGRRSWSRKIAVVSCQQNVDGPQATELAWADIIDWGADDMWHLGDWGYWGGRIKAGASYKQDLGFYAKSMKNFPIMKAAIQSTGLNAVLISDHEISINGDPHGRMHDSPESIRELVAFQKLFPVRRYGDTRKPRRGRYYYTDIGAVVRVIVTDFRTPDRSNLADPDGPDKTMFGAVQLAWLLTSLDRSKVNLIVNESSWLATPNPARGTCDKPWSYYYEQQIIADHITEGGYHVAWIGGDRHYVGYLAGQGTPHNTLGEFPCYISSGTSMRSLELAKGELMTWQFGAGHTDPKLPVCGYMQLTLSYDGASHEVSLTGRGRAVLDTSAPVSEWLLENIPGGIAEDCWKL